MSTPVVDPAVPNDPRALAALAANRGWLDIGAVFDAGRRFERLGPTAPISEVLGLALSPAQLAMLTALPFSATVASEVPALMITAAHPYLADGAPPIQKQSLDASAPTARYVLGASLGEGGMGTVTAALDRETGRTIAIKTLRADVAFDPSIARRFLNEARITAQLEHPAVIPVHDMGALPDGRPYYAMRIVKQRSLREVFDQPLPRREWPLARLCALFVQVCRAMAYAHTRGVIHRDLKPENILLGDYGEVYVADWGIAKLLGHTEIDVAPTGVTAESVTAGTLAGTMLGTLGYAPPEQLGGEMGKVGPASDLFALGVILYEMLTHASPFDGPNAYARIYATLMTEPVPPRDHVPACPIVLEELCVRLLAKKPEDRPASAAIVADEVEAYLEGAKEKARRQAEAVALAGVAKTHADRYEALTEAADQRGADAKRALRDVKAWERLDRKRPGWALEDAARDADVEQATEMAASVRSYSQALGYDAESQAARSGLAALYYGRYERAERQRDEATRRFQEAMVRQYDDGRYAPLLSADARVSITTPRARAEVVAYRYVEVDRVMRAVQPRALGNTPVRDAKLEPGSWLLVVSAPGFRVVRYPVLCRRGERHEAAVNLYTESEIGADFLCVPGGPCVIGGDLEAFDPLPQREVVMPDFAIGRLPVTLAEYLEFVNDLQQSDPQQARKRSPRLEQTSDVMAIPDERGVWAPLWQVIVEGDQAKQYAPRERVGEIPAMGLDWFDAVAYCAWKGARDGVAYRLPAEVEWEKAARGADGRRFPWGDRFDATFCKMRESRSGFGQPEPAGAFASDESVYGVRDLAGGMRCWVGDIDGETSAEDALRDQEPPPGTPRDQAGMRLSRGGAWLSNAPWCRAASRARNFSLYRFSDIGLRLARPLARRD